MEGTTLSDAEPNFREELPIPMSRYTGRSDMTPTGKTTSKTTTMTTRVPENLAAAFDAVALIRNEAVGVLMREALEQWLVRNVSLQTLEKQLLEAADAAAERQRAEQQQTIKLALAGARQAAENVDREPPMEAEPDSRRGSTAEAESRPAEEGVSL
jgi:hypothetical protein